MPCLSAFLAVAVDFLEVGIDDTFLAGPRAVAAFFTARTTSAGIEGFADLHRGLHQGLGLGGDFGGVIGFERRFQLSDGGFDRLLIARRDFVAVFLELAFGGVNKRFALVLRLGQFAAGLVVASVFFGFLAPADKFGRRSRPVASRCRAEHTRRR
jgi:hypothetical protein